MKEHKDLTAEIDALVQNSGKKRISSSKARKLGIVVDKKKSSNEMVSGEFYIATDETFLDGSVERVVNDKHAFSMKKDGDLIIEKYDPNGGVSREIMKTFRDLVSSIIGVADNGEVSVPLSPRNVFKCTKKQIFIICETGRNIHVKNTVNEMLFSGKAQHHFDTEEWGSEHREKSLKWCILETERCAHKGESVIVSGDFKNWYELMPIAVIASMYGFELAVGRTAGQRMSMGNIVDVNVVMDHFMANHDLLSQFRPDPYSAISAFRDIDKTISSMVIFPSILHTFFQR